MKTDLWAKRWPPGGWVNPTEILLSNVIGSKNINVSLSSILIAIARLW